LGDVEPGRGAAEMQLFRHGNEVTEVPQLHPGFISPAYGEMTNHILDVHNSQP
jgi:hypothetical protein